MKYAAIAAVAISLAACSGGGSSIAPKANLTTKADSTSYAIGVNIGSSFKTQELDIDMNAFSAGLLDAMNEDTSAVKLTEAELEGVFARLQEEMYEKQMAKMAEMQQENLTAGDAFFAENATKDGVMTTASGLQYKVITEGNGSKPSIDSEVVIHYRGRLLDGTEFDNSYNRGEPATRRVNEFIDGFMEGLQLMSVGSKYEFYIPSSLAYGEQGNQVIPPNSALIFEIELIAIN